MIPLFQQNPFTTPGWLYPEVLDYWDARYGIAQADATERVSGWTPSLKGSDVLAQGTAANQPILLPYSGTNYLWLPGVDSNTASAPDSAALSVTGDIDLRFYVALLDYTPSVIQTLSNKWSAGAAYSYGLQVLTDGTLRAVYGLGGLPNTSRTAVSTAANGVTDNTAVYLRWTRVAATDTHSFYKSTDGTTWTQIGVDVVGSFTGALNDSAAALTIGMNPDAAQPVAGKIYRVQLYSGIAGTLVFDANFTQVAEGATTFTESSSNAATVTINSIGAKPAYIVGSQIILGDAAAYYLQGTFALNAPYFVVEVAMKPTWASGQVSWDGKTANSFALQDITATPQQRLHDGSASGATKSPVLSQWYVKAATQDASGNATFQLNLNAPTADTLSHTAMAGFTAFADGSGANFASGMKKAIAVGNTTISAARLNQLIMAMGSKYGVNVT